MWPREHDRRADGAGDQESGCRREDRGSTPSARIPPAPRHLRVAVDAAQDIRQQGVAIRTSCQLSESAPSAADHRSGVERSSSCFRLQRTLKGSARVPKPGLWCPDGHVEVAATGGGSVQVMKEQDRPLIDGQPGEGGLDRRGLGLLRRG